MARETSASAAIASTVVPAKPRSANSRSAAVWMASRVACYLRSRSPGMPLGSLLD